MSWYDPKDAVTVAPEGWYPATIISSEMSQTKKGDPMEVIKFRVFGQQRAIVISDYFHPQNLWKLKKLATALGQAQEFLDGTFEASKFMGKPIEVELQVEDSPQYGEQNRVGKFDADKTNTNGLPANADVSPSPPQQRQGSAHGGYDSPAPTSTIDPESIPF